MSPTLPSVKTCNRIPLNGGRMRQFRATGCSELGRTFRPRSSEEQTPPAGSCDAAFYCAGASMKRTVTRRLRCIPAEVVLGAAGAAAP